MGTSDQGQRFQTGMSTRPLDAALVCQPASQEQQEKENALTLFSLVFPEFLVGVGDRRILRVGNTQSHDPPLCFYLLCQLDIFFLVS